MDKCLIYKSFALCRSISLVALAISRLSVWYHFVYSSQPSLSLVGLSFSVSLCISCLDYGFLKQIVFHFFLSWFQFWFYWFMFRCIFHWFFFTNFDFLVGVNLEGFGVELGDEHYVFVNMRKIKREN